MNEKPTKLYQLRTERGLTRAYVAEQCGISVRSLGAFENGATDINRAAAITVHRLAQVLGVDYAEVLNLEVSE